MNMQSTNCEVVCVFEPSERLRTVWSGGKGPAEAVVNSTGTNTCVFLRRPCCSVSLLQLQHGPCCWLQSFPILPKRFPQPLSLSATLIYTPYCYQSTAILFSLAPTPLCVGILMQIRPWTRVACRQERAQTCVSRCTGAAHSPPKEETVIDSVVISIPKQVSYFSNFLFVHLFLKYGSCEIRYSNPQNEKKE